MASPAHHVSVREVREGKGTLCRSVLVALPDWFGIPSAIDDYCVAVEHLPVFAAVIEARDIGFIALDTSDKRVAEIHVMGVLAEHHRQGVGRVLVDKAREYASGLGAQELRVKTLSPSRPDPWYARTLKFYQSVGFKGVAELPDIWGPSNPCLLMALPLDGPDPTGGRGRPGARPPHTPIRET